MKVLIFGLGLNQGGVGSAKFFATQDAKVRVTDLKSKEILKPSLDQLKKYQIEYTLGEHKYEDIDWADLIIKNPAVKPGNPYIDYVLKQGKQVEMDMGIFLKYVKPSQIIGVTGTKGKSTTASLVYEILQKTRGSNVFNTGGWIASNPRKVVFAGNIGTSVLDIIPEIKSDTLVILEISSFQLESFATHKVSPKWAVITNIYPDHLNYYQSIDEYIAAKKWIAINQKKDDFLFMRKADPILDTKDFFKGIDSKIIKYSIDDLPDDFHPNLAGQHNLENMAAALAVGSFFGLDKKYILKTLSQFRGVPFRMELIREWNGVKIYNDTTATNPDASIQAIKTLGANSRHPPGELILICGGMNKNMPYDGYAKTVDKYAKKVFFLQGDSTEEIRKLMKKQNLIAGTYHDLEKLLSDVKTTIQPGDIVLFSPAATSFNLFQNEFDRGRKFNQAIQKIFS